MATMSKTDHATGEWMMMFESDGDGRPDSYWCIEQDPDGFLCVTSNAVTRERVDASMYRGWDADQMRADFARKGVPAAVIDRFIEQVGL